MNVQLAAAAAAALRKALDERLSEFPDSTEGSALFESFARIFDTNFRVSINVHPETLLSMLQDDRVRYINLHDRLKANLIEGYDQEFAALREGIDSLAFGSAGKKITYGAVNLGNHGLISYGAVCVYLSNDAIKPRTSFLQENSFTYVTGVPPGIKLDLLGALRAVWDTVHILAFVKHSCDLKSGAITLSRLIELILVSTGDKHRDRFIEAQVYPPLTMKNFAKVTYDPRVIRQRGSDRLVTMAAELTEDLLREAAAYQNLFALKLSRANIQFEVISGDAAI